MSDEVQQLIAWCSAHPLETIVIAFLLGAMLMGRT